MTDDRTPLQRLDDAVHAYMAEAELLTDGAFVTGWALVSTSTRIQSEAPEYLPAVPGMQYCVGPQTSIAAAAGMAKFLDTVAERYMWQMLNGGDE